MQHQRYKRWEYSTRFIFLTSMHWIKKKTFQMNEWMNELIWNTLIRNEWNSLRSIGKTMVDWSVSIMLSLSWIEKWTINGEFEAKRRRRNDNGENFHITNRFSSHKSWLFGFQWRGRHDFEWIDLKKKKKKFCEALEWLLDESVLKDELFILFWWSFIKQFF